MKTVSERTLRKASANRSPLMRLLRYLAPQRRLVLAAVICSLLNKLFEQGHARSAVGMVIPFNFAVEIEMVVELKG